MPGTLINEDAELLLCQKMGFIDMSRELTPIGLQALEEFKTFQTKTKTKVTVEVLGKDFLEKVKEYLEIFPKGRIPTSKELARQGVDELKQKFVWFRKTYPEYSWDVILDATEYYVYLKSLEEYNYMVTSSYFIKKTDPRTKETASKLADHCQLITDNPNLLKELQDS
ncbi:MAG: hypothetical protein ACR2IJ_04450 [Fluviibacter sp.]